MESCIASFRLLVYRDWSGVKNKAISTVIRVAVSVGFLSYLYIRMRDKVDVKAFVSIIRDINYLDIISLFIIAIILALWKAYSWKFILQRVTIASQVPYKDFLFSVLASNTFNLVVPGHGGDFIRFVYLRGKVEVGKCLGSLFLERFFFVISLSLISIFGTVIRKDFCLFLLNIVIAFLAFSFVLLIFSKSCSIFVKKNVTRFQMLRKTLKHLESFEEFGVFVRSNKIDVGVYFCFCILFWMLVMFQLDRLFGSMHIEVSVITLLSIIPTGILVSMVPISMGGLGVREVAFSELLRGFVPANQIIAFAAMFYVVRYLFPALLGLPFIVSMRLRSTPVEQADANSGREV